MIEQENNKEEATLHIFVSSTFRDLQEEREAVREVIDELADQFPVAWVGMEEFGSFGASPFEVSTAFAEKADIVVLIVAESYGSIAPDRRMSFTDAELRVVLRDKILCLAYLRVADESKLDPHVANFRARINQELTTSPFTDIRELKYKVRRDLVRELRNYSIEPSNDGYDIETPPYSDPDSFQGREEALRQLGDGLALEAAHVGVWGSRGIGKTTFVQYFFALQKELYDPIWLRVDDLFGRFPNGRPRIGMKRWPKELLLQRLRIILEERPRAVLVFDNVQAAPLLVGWLVGRIGKVRAVFLSWDLKALPSCKRIIRLETLQTPEAIQLLTYYCHDEQSYEGTEIEELSRLLGNHPLLLTMAGRRLNLMPNLRVADCVVELRNANARLQLQGPRADDAEETVRTLLLSSYHCLIDVERQTLSALAALPARGISEESLQWLLQKLAGEQIRDMHRAEQLGFMERRKVADWRGHRFRLRSLIADFLKTTDHFPRGNTLVEGYLISEEVYTDSSTDIVGVALQKQMEESAPNIPGGTWSLDLLVYGRPAIRGHVRQLLAGWKEDRQLGMLAEEVARLLRVVRPDEITLELIGLLEKWRLSESVEQLEKIWLRPKALYGHQLLLSNEVQFATGKALAAQMGLSITEFLHKRLHMDEQQQIYAALDAIYAEGIPQIEEDLMNLIDHSDPDIRSRTAGALSSFESPSPEMKNRLFLLFENDPHHKVRYIAATTLGVWADRRVLPYILSLLQDEDDDIRAEACSILWRFRLPEVADALYNQALHDEASYVIENAAFVLTDFMDPRSGELFLQLLKNNDNERSRQIGASLAATLDIDFHSPEILQEISDTIAGWLKTESTEFRLLARCTLLNLRDERGYQGLWQDLKEPLDVYEVYRSFLLQKLAIWQPSNFEPLRLRPLLHDQNPTVRANAALIVGQVRERRLIEELLLLLEDETVDPVTNKTVAMYASEALDRIAGKREPWKPYRKAPIQDVRPS